MPTDLGRRIIDEQEEWADFASREFGDDVRLHYVSPLDSDRRIYRFGNKLAKVQRLRDGSGQSERLFGQKLQSESTVLQHLEDTRGPRLEPAYHRSGDWEYLEMNYFEGTPYREAWSRTAATGKPGLALRTAREVFELNRCGVFHGDVAASNLIVDPSGRVNLVDFGNARLAGAAYATVREWSRILFGRHGLAARKSKDAILRVLPVTQAIYRELALRRVKPFAASRSTDPHVKLLEEAWRESARWHTSLGSWLSYGSITVDGNHFPGQRPWLLRWNHISKRVSFGGKRVLDLGCNIGLLSTFASLSGATSCLGLEADPALVGAARKISEAFGANATFEVADIDELRPDDARVRDRDIIVAMSIMEWVKDKDNLLAVIGKANEVLIESHDSVETETNRVRRAGFDRSDVISVSERGRPIIYGWKTAVASYL